MGYGGNPLGCAVAMAAMEVMEAESLAENAEVMGGLFRSTIQSAIDSHEVPIVEQVRGMGLLNAIVIDKGAEENFAAQSTDFHDDSDHTLAWDVCLRLAEAGVLVSICSSLNCELFAKSNSLCHRRNQHMA